MAKLLLIRHGKINLQRENRYWGSTDIPLNDVGIRQAEQIRDYLAKETINHIYSSELSRTRDTAKILAEPRRLNVITCNELNEFNFGYAEGLTYDEIKKLHPSLAEEMARMEGISFPGGENLDKFSARVKTFLSRLGKHKAEDVIAIIGHAGSLRMLICHLLGLEHKYWYRFFIDHGSISVVNTYQHINILNSLNDTSHLRAIEN